MNAGAIERIGPIEPGAFGRVISSIPGALERLDHSHSGAFGALGRVFWAQMRGLKYMVLNNHLDQSLYEYLQNTKLENTVSITTSTTPEASEEKGENGQVVEVETVEEIENWDISKLLGNFSPHARRELSEKDLSVEALISCLLYIASSKGDNLGLGYVVDKLKWDPQDGQGGIYRRLAGEGREEIVARLRHYIEYRSFQNRHWRVAMGTPSVDKILELLEYLGIDSSRFGSQEEWGL